MVKGTKRRTQFSSGAHDAAGTMQHLKLAFPAIYSSNPKIRFNQIIKILDQVCKQYNKQIPTFAWKPISITSRELKTILGTKSIPEDSLTTMTQKGDISVIHASKKQQTFGKRYTLQINHDDGSNISLAVAGSRDLYDLLIDINQDGTLLLSHKALLRSTNSKRPIMMMELQLATMPSGKDDNENTDSYMYSLSYKHPFKRSVAADAALLKVLQHQFQQLLLTPDLYVGDINNDEYVQKITDLGFEKMFGVKLLQGLSVDGDDNNIISDLKSIHSAYCRLQPHIDGHLAYDAGIKNGNLQDVSQKSLLNAILTQAKKKQFLPVVVIVKVNDLVGYGLIAGEYISAGTIIGEYCGEILRISGQDKDKQQQDNTYFAAYAPDEVPGSELFVVDARKGGNPTRFINHSDENANAIWAHVFDGKSFRPVIVAFKPIHKGKQILLKYKDSYWSSKRTRGSSRSSDTPYPL